MEIREREVAERRRGKGEFRAPVRRSKFLGVIKAAKIRDYLNTKNLNLLATVSQRILALLFWKYKGYAPSFKK